MRASAKQWTVVMALSFMLTGVTTLAGQSLDTGQLQTKEDSTQLQGTDQSTPAKPVARLMLGSDSSTPLAQQDLLSARRALAMGDVVTANQHVAKAKSMESPASVQATIAAVEQMISRHQELARMQQAGDTAYNRQAAAFLLQQANELLKMGDWQTAETLAQTAKQFNVKFESGLTPESVLAGIAQAKTGSPSDSSLREEAVRLMSEMKLAMDQNQLAKAQQALTSLKAMNIQDSMLSAEDDRPWQLELQLQSALRQQASSTVASTENAEMVATADFQPETDSSQVVQASTTAAAPPLQFNSPQDGAIELYLRGVQAMNSGNRTVAQELFDKAWEQRDTLDGAIRDALVQKMTLLKNTVPATTISSRSTIQEEAAPVAPDMGMGMDTQSQLILQKMRQHVIKQRAAADKLVEDKKPRNAVIVLQQLRSEVEQSDVDTAAKAGLLTMVDRELVRLNEYINTHSSEIATEEANASRMEEVLQDRETRYANEQKIQLLVEEFNTLKHEQRFAEARLVARQAAELSPNLPAVVAMTTEAKYMEAIDYQERMNELREDRQLATWVDAEVAATPMDPNMPYEHGDARTWQEISTRRELWLEEQNMGDPTEYRIYQVLRNHKVQTSFVGTPLEVALNTLGDESGLNIVFDARGIAAENVDVSAPVNLNLNQPISLDSALNLILSNFALIYVVENESIKITTRSASPMKLESRTVYVGDLVHPIPNFQGINPISIMSAGGVVTSAGMGVGGQAGSAGQMVGAISATNSGSNYANPTLLAQQLDPTLAGADYGMAGTQTPTVNPTTGLGGQVQADFTSLINLIQSTVEPLSWEENGGPAGATITEFRNTNSLVIRNTQEVHNQIQTLLKRLRELQDVQIVIETRFISLSDSFFERIGVDFDFQIDDNSGFDQNTLGSLDDGGRSVTVGRLGDGNLTLPADLDIPFSQDSFSEAIPQFGGFGSAANFGFAILSDIEVFFLIQAANGDQRSNIMTAPKITLFNGQFGSVSDVVSRSFVTSVTPVVGSFAAAHAPVISTLAEGTMMSVQAVVSHDRRFVRLTLVPTFTKLNDVQEFTFTGSTTTDTGSNIFDPTDGSLLGSNNQTTTREGVTVQQPVFAITQVSATVAVPDGGTVLLGGVKRLSESRIERGIPFLSNLPYVNRLFKNVGIGRDTSSLMLMVTPRVIIKEEEEARQVGLAP